MTANELLGRTVSFDHPDMPAAGVRLVGVITAAKDNARTARGNIPDFLVTIRGASGATKIVSFVEAYVRITQ